MRFACLFALTVLLALVPAVALAGTVTIENYTPGETIDYSVALLKGTLSDQSATEVAVTNCSSQRDTRELKGLARNGKFKALCHLVEGENRVVVACGDAKAEVTINYQPNANPYFVRAIYMTDCTGETEFQTPEDECSENYADRIGTSMLLMQTMTAERMHDLGFGRSTFNLELDEQGDVIVHLMKGERAACDYYALPDGEWWRVVYGEVARNFSTNDARNLVIPAYTRFNPETKKPDGHTALGGGALALFGSGNLFTWPEDLADAQPAMMDATLIDRDHFMDDSVGRSCYWGAASTTVGAALHELGHTMGLPHTNQPHDIMTRGIDRFHRVFTLVDAPSRHNKSEREFVDDAVACFPPVSAYALLTSPFLADDDPTGREQGDVGCEYDADAEEFVFRSEHGVAYVSAADSHGNVRFFQATELGDRPSNEMRIAEIDIRKAIADGTFRLRAINATGRRRNWASDSLMPKALPAN